jgi:hypothetical protein
MLRMPKLLRNSLKPNKFLKKSIINKKGKAFGFITEKQNILFLSAFI